MCLEWYSKIRSQNIPVAVSIVQEKAKENAQNWNDKLCGLEKWRTRHNISFKVVCGEATVCEKELQFRSFKPENVFNPGETNLFSRVLPNKT